MFDAQLDLGGPEVYRWESEDGAPVPSASGGHVRFPGEVDGAYHLTAVTLRDRTLNAGARSTTGGAFHLIFRVNGESYCESGSSPTTVLSGNGTVVPLDDLERNG